MSEILLLAVAAIALLTLVVAGILLARQKSAGGDDASARALREELAAGADRTSKALITQMTSIATVQNNQIDGFSRQLVELTGANERRLIELRETVDAKLGEIRQTVETRLDSLQKDNSEKLDKMRATVDEKLHETLEKRLGESFKQVADRLEQVHKGLGEMQTLAAGVGDLKRVLTNVKTRGTWGEVQLGDAAGADADARAVRDERGDQARIARARGVRDPAAGPRGRRAGLAADRRQVPGRGLRAAAGGAGAGRRRRRVEAAAKALETRARASRRGRSATSTSTPPQTTDFAILFLPTEGLYAEVLRRPGLSEALQREYRVTHRRTDHAVGDAEQPADGLSHAGDREALERGLEGAGRGQDGVRQVRRGAGRDQAPAADRRPTPSTRPKSRTRAMETQLKGVEALPETEAQKLLGSADDGPAP